ncbi:hypothetical protein [Winogradskyella sediminis]|uniref:hypothetical protein n=1 Tax=Winogradskyella sediminis TaxID=1382466 RepID=UPI003AA9122B
MIYFTFNDQPSGIYQSQVVDVLSELNLHVDKPIRLVAFISIRNYGKNRRKIKSLYPNSIILMMFPRLNNWKMNLFQLAFVKGIKKEAIFARGPMAFYLANKLNSNVTYDGRGAVKAEMEEYPKMIPNKKLVHSIISAERSAVLNAKYKIAVSEKLVEYWRNEFDYRGSNHIIIPCTLTKSMVVDEEFKKELFFKYNWGQKDIVLIYSGSIAGWQSFEKISDLIEKWIEAQNVKVLFLSKRNDVLEKLILKYPNNIKQEWVGHDEVGNYLSIGDYGILIREDNVTNAVASPVKFAEYLNSGLKVLISKNIGDYSSLVEKQDLGSVIYEDIIPLQNVSHIDKDRIKKFVQRTLTKKSNRNNYKQFIREVLK